ncbi:hypothetical protein TRFO_13866 [Tritrichomonas foetus]|uniref:Uncharacterized protein n=1 Tax=Tritrichomonas foetus TaxID=1144522 RepID=A0A1J4KXU0_9EUKA|nr:hypothetical protein TRFO_13866 [Tritrichomonas foetus]|eukprot:OHT15704.1 hypothetical protein TRFO_13866 [Tritrichomonas foetus]
MTWCNFLLIYANLLIAVFVGFHIFSISEAYKSSNIYNISQLVGSTNRDIVFFYATQNGDGLMLSIASLRQTGCRCRIILFVSKMFEITDSLVHFLTVNDVEIITHCDEKKGREYAPHMLRYEYELVWLENHINEVDRILHSDAFDVFFQGDPFTSSIDNSSLTFVVEPHCIRSCGWNIAWINQCYGAGGVDRLRHHFIICSGSISGPAIQYLNLLKLMTSQPAWKSCWGTSLDQPILNYLVWTGEVEKSQIQYKLTGCDGGFFTMQWCVVDKTVLMNEHNQIVSSFNTVPSYVHQYNRFPEIIKWLKELYHL